MASNLSAQPGSANAYCPRCGSPIAAGSGFCAKCGAPASGAMVGLPMAAPVATPPKKSRKKLWIIIAVVVVVVIAVIAVLALIGASVAVDVTAINFTSTDNACGTAGSTAAGFTTGTGGTVQYTLTITNPNLFTSCTVASVSALTSGFSISGANTPLTIPVGGTESLSFTITAPGSNFDGVLTIDLE